MIVKSLKVLALVSVLVSASAALLSQEGAPFRRTLDDRLAEIEDRIASVEAELAAQREMRDREEAADRLTLESEAKLDRLEVRVIQLESRPVGAAGAGRANQQLTERVRSLERQVARLRSTALR